MPLPDVHRRITSCIEERVQGGQEEELAEAEGAGAESEAAAAELEQVEEQAAMALMLEQLSQKKAQLMVRTRIATCYPDRVEASPHFVPV